MIHPKFSPKEAIAEATNNLLKAFMIAAGSDKQTATMFGAIVSGAIKGISMENRQSVYNGLNIAIKKSWIEVLSKEEFDCLDETCKTKLKEDVITTQNVFEVLTADKPENVLRTKIILVLKKHTNWNSAILNEYARFMAEQLLIAVNKEIEYDGILSLLHDIENLRSDFLDRQDSLEDLVLEYFNRVIKKLENINISAIPANENTVSRYSVPELFWNAGKTWYENSRKPGARFHSLDIVRNILPSATDTSLDLTEEEYKFPFKAYYTDEHNIQCSRFSDLLLDINSIYHQGHFMLIGEGGIGKTTTLMSAMYDAYNNKEFYTNESVIPLFIELSLSPDSKDSPAYNGTSSSVIHRIIYAMLNQKDSNKDRSDLLQECMNDKSNTAKYAVRELLFSADDKENKETRYVLLIDGLNEVSEEPFATESFTKKRSSSAQGRILQEIVEIINKYHNVTIVLTGRSKISIDQPSFHYFYMRGLEWDEITFYLRDKGKKNEEEISLIQNGDKGLKNVLSIPMFLTMYVLLSKTEGIVTRSELMKTFFHERFEHKKRDYEIQRQGDIAKRIQWDEEQSVTNEIKSGRMITLSMQWMFLDILIPEIAAKMEESKSFQISEEDVCYLLEFLFNDQNSLYCGINKKISNICFKKQFQQEYLENVIFDFTKAYDYKVSRYTVAFLKFCVSSMGILYKEGDSTYGFIHQHLRDYFAAVYYINRMKLAYVAFLKKDVLLARTILHRFDEAPLSTLLITYIGEYLGEHHNNPLSINCIKDSNLEYINTEEKLIERHLISNLLNIYRGIDSKNNYCIYNLIEIINRVRKDLSGADLHALDLQRCLFYKIPMDTQPGINFSKAIINGSGWFADGHVDSITSACWSPDGNRIVTASDDGTAKVWDVVTGALIFTLKGHLCKVKCVSYSPDGTKILTAPSYGVARVWDANTGELTHELNELFRYYVVVNSVSWSPDGTKIVTTCRGTAQIWDANTGMLIQILEGLTGKILFASYNLGGNQIVTTSSDGSTHIWDAKTGDYINTLEGKATSSCWSPDGSKIITTSDNTIKIWSADKGVMIDTLEIHTDSLYSVCWSPDRNRIISIDSDGVVWIWDTDTESKVLKLGKNIKTVSCNQDGNRIVTVDWFGTAQLWDTVTGTLVPTLQGYIGYVSFGCWSPDGTKIVTAFDRTAQIWDANTGMPIQTLEGLTGKIVFASYNLDGNRIITASYYRTARIWDVDNKRLITTIGEHKDQGGFSSFSIERNRISTICDNGTICIWDASTGKLLHTNIISVANEGTRMFSSPDGERIFTYYNEGVVWDANTGKQLCKLNGNIDGLDKVYWNSRGTRIVTVSFFNRSDAKVWDASSGKLLYEYKGNAYRGRFACYIQDKNRIVTISDSFPDDFDVAEYRTIEVLDADTGAVHHIMEADIVGNISSASYNSNESRIVTAFDDGTSYVWNTTSGILDFKLEGHNSDVLYASWNSDGTRIITASADNTTRVWNALTGKLIQTLYEVPGLNIKGIDLRNIDSKSLVSDIQKEIFRQYGAII